MYDKFRDLEKTSNSRRIDLILMATVSGFENLARPGRNETKQFAELFAGLFAEARPETRRTAVAALSRCVTLPAATKRLILEQPIDVSAPFLANSVALDEAELLRIVATGDPACARAIARRPNLSAATVEGLSALSDPVVSRSLSVRGLIDPAAPDTTASTTAQPESAPSQDAEHAENVRTRLREMVSSHERKHPSLPKLKPGEISRLRHFVESDEPLFFATALADVLGSSFRLAERTMLDISGRELAETLTALGFAADDIAHVLTVFFPNLRRSDNGVPRAFAIANACERESAGAHLAARLDADHTPAEDDRQPSPDDSRPFPANDVSRIKQA
ncbi:DUF2336 domain-containing protein [Pararhizobium mangrovi]|uniref:DUF2336 domain-containing protein n=1 Tax=Pararhizobium mangrovi TaxID=2590452 RepID=A0A506UHE8_9HYPH|nr:DUF2336 domain-containing protein [Pararhizobium mangrovi]TPW32731.1 DUF2336 domain-containing protein [Pararhizobium mangrovi]